MCNKMLDYVEQHLGEEVNFFINTDIGEGFHNAKQFFHKAEDKKYTN